MEIRWSKCLWTLCITFPFFLSLDQICLLWFSRYLLFTGCCQGCQWSSGADSESRVHVNVNVWIRCILCALFRLTIIWKAKHPIHLLIVTIKCTTSNLFITCRVYLDVNHSVNGLCEMHTLISLHHLNFSSRALVNTLLSPDLLLFRLI